VPLTCAFADGRVIDCVDDNQACSGGVAGRDGLAQRFGEDERAESISFGPARAPRLIGLRVSRLR
jgi:hypothetical protein